MGGEQIETPARGQAQPGQNGRVTWAAGTSGIAHGMGRAKAAGLYHITPECGEPFTVDAKGREAWALDRLRWAGPKGCTPIEQPAPRWSAYVHRLRRLGVSQYSRLKYLVAAQAEISGGGLRVGDLNAREIVPEPRHLASRLRGIVFVGEPHLGPRFYQHGIGLCAVRKGGAT